MSIFVTQPFVLPILRVVNLHVLIHVYSNRTLFKMLDCRRSGHIRMCMYMHAASCVQTAYTCTRMYIHLYMYMYVHVFAQTYHAQCTL